MTYTTSRETEDENAMWDALHDPESPFYRCELKATHEGDCKKPQKEERC